MASKVKKANAPLARQSRPETKVSPAQDRTGASRTPSLRMLAIVLVVVASAVYFNTMSNGYVLDDFSAIKSNTIVTKGISAIPEIFSTPYRHGYFITSNDLYRPLSLAMFAVEYEFAGPSPAVGHFFNIAVFACCVVLLFFFLVRFFEGKKTGVAFIAALLFALHPIHTEVVANIKSRDELLCFLFSFLSLNIFVRYANEGSIMRLVSGIFCFFLALLSKETAITLLAVIPVIFFFYLDGNRKRSVRIVAGVVAASAIFLFIRASVLHAYNANHGEDTVFIDNFLVAAPSAIQGFATEMYILGQYVRLLVVPYPLICDYSYNSIPFVGFDNLWVLLSVALYAALGYVGVRALVKRNKNPFAFAALFFLATISLFSNVFFFIGTAMAERLLFFPSVGFCLAVALALEKWVVGVNDGSLNKFGNTKVAATLLPLAIIYAAITFTRNIDWESNFTLYSADIKKAPEDSRLAYYYGLNRVTEADNEPDPQAKRKLIFDGFRYLRQALRIYPDYEYALAEMAAGYMRLGNFDSVEKYAMKAYRINPKDEGNIANLSGVYFNKQKFDSALLFCKKALSINPGLATAYSNEGLCFIFLNRPDSAIYYLRKATAINPTKEMFKRMSLAFEGLKEPDSVKRYRALTK